MKRGFIVEQCPKCGDDTGYYVKENVKGMAIINFKMDGMYDENSNYSIYDEMVHTPATKWAYCRKCHSRIIKLENITLGD